MGFLPPNIVIDIHRSFTSLRCPSFPHPSRAENDVLHFYISTHGLFNLPPPRNQASLRAYQPLVSFNKVGYDLFLGVGKLWGDNLTSNVA